MISLLVLLLLSVVVVGGAHAPPSSTIRHRTLQDRDTSSASVCSPTSFEYGGPCDVLTQDGKKCFFDYVYVGDCGATEEELECLPEMTCTCNGLRDETWACPQDRRRDSMTLEMRPACPDTGAESERGKTCIPPSPTSASTTSSSSLASSTSSTSSGPATADDGTTPLPSKNAVDNDNDIVSVEVPTPAIVDANDSSTTITVKEGESDGAMSSLSSSSSSSQQQQGLGVAKAAMVAAATAAGIALFL